MSECKQGFSKEINHSFEFSLKILTFFPPWLILKLHNCDNPKAAKSDIENRKSIKIPLSSHDFFLQATEDKPFLVIGFGD